MARGVISRDQRTVIVIEDRCQRTGILQQIHGAIRDEIFAHAIEQRDGMELGRTPARVEDAIRLFRMAPECFGPSLGHRVSPGTDAAVGMCREPSQHRTRREIDEMQWPGRHDDTSNSDSGGFGSPHSRWRPVPDSGRTPRGTHHVDRSPGTAFRTGLDLEHKIGHPRH
jgi:hypothetical protein